MSALWFRPDPSTKMRAFYKLQFGIWIELTVSEMSAL